ncbi:MAG TPA: VTT domain-containing protein [Marmoricola sp.]|nr:VTT domain-containing protein [Marmoricola sp.]
MDLLTPLLLGLDWMDPEWWLARFDQQMFWAAVAIVFVECGLLFPILPGDSLLFAVGLFVSTGSLDVNIAVACVILSAAAFAGNVAGYEIGRKIGPPLFHREGRFLNTANFTKTHDFFEKYGNKALVLGRFVPIVRTFITVIAGAGAMDRRRFFGWSFVGAVLWATGLTLIGYFLGEAVPALSDHLELAVLLIVAVSVLPMAFEWWKHRREVRRTSEEIVDDLS